MRRRSRTWPTGQAFRSRTRSGGPVPGRADTGRPGSVVVPGQERGQALDGVLEVGVRVDERAQPVGQPRERDLLVAAPRLELLDPTVGEVHAAKHTNRLPRV